MSRRRSLAVVLDDVSRASSPPAHVVATPVATAIAGDATRTLALSRGRAALAMLIAFTNLRGTPDRPVDRLPARAGDQERARRAPLRDCEAVAAGGAGARRDGDRRRRAARVVDDACRWRVLPWSNSAASRNRDVAVSWRVIACRGPGRASACAWICALAAGLSGGTTKCCRRAAPRRHAAAAGAEPAARVRRRRGRAGVRAARVGDAPRPEPARGAQRKPGVRRSWRVGIAGVAAGGELPDLERVVSFYSALQSARGGTPGIRARFQSSTKSR